MTELAPRVKAVRGRAIDARILSVTLDILRGHGPAAVNIEAVAAKAGIAKTTIYRRYDSREHLLRAAIESSTAEVAIPTDLPTYETFKWLLHDAARMAENMVGRGAAASIILNDHPESNDLMREMIKARSVRLTEFLHERVAAGDLKADLDIGLAATVLLGALFGQLIRGGELDDAWADSVLELLWPGFSA
ncbi:TetR/AcrR family transcriptional regulator [Conyzicola sp.]|uniref:TetR/AcrR family transcriptional regulator n=1 Tax=Conyzicola sp. TaxID=1969404 RepID=UPI003989F7A2